MGYGVIGSPTGSGPVSLGSSPGTPAACAERGSRYLKAVSSMEAVGNRVIATVRGSADYLVVLTLPDASSGARLRGECGCPYGQEGFFCKHCVAVGLAILRDAARVPRQRRK